MDACTSASAIQLVLAVFGFLAAVLSLELFWVRVPEQLLQGDLDAVLKKRSWLNGFVAAGAAGAVALLVRWVSVCTNGAF
jgi:hypothetical protein